MFEDLKVNLEQEKKIVADMKSIVSAMSGDAVNRDFYMNTLSALAGQLDILNNSVPGLLNEWSLVGAASVVANEGKKDVAPKKDVVRMSYISPSTNEKKLVALKDKDRKEFLSKLKLSEDALKGVKRLEEKRAVSLIKKPSAYASFSSKIFSGISDSLTPSFDSLGKDLKRANIRFLLSSYLSMAIMSGLLAFGFGAIVFAGLFLINPSNWIYVFLPFGFMGVVWFMFYVYPASEAGSVQKNISYELPFATIHMAAIAGSDIEPVKIFKIIGESEEYKAIGTEIRKVITQVEVYGYDLVTALKNVANTVPNRRLSELFSGLATNISSGGALKNYLEKKSENFLMDYQLERQKYTALAGTFMDVYISILIAAPLILMMMFIVMNVAGLGMGGLGIDTLLFLAIFAIAIVNVIFLFAINAKQPKV